MLSRMDPLLNKWQGEDNNKEVCTILKKYHPDKSSVGFIIFVPAYDLSNKTHTVVLRWKHAVRTLG